MVSVQIDHHRLWNTDANFSGCAAASFANCPLNPCAIATSRSFPAGICCTNDVTFSISSAPQFPIAMRNISVVHTLHTRANNLSF